MWDRLEHAYGPATDVPDLVAQVRDPVTAPAAIGELNANVYHDGDAIHSAAPALLPHLLDLAEDPTVTVRRAVVDTVGDLAHAARTAHPDAVDPAWPRAWAEAVPRLLRLLADPDVEVRRVVTFPLAHSRSVWPALRDRFTVEPDPAARLGLVVAVAHHADPDARDWLTGLLADRTFRLAAAVGLRRLGIATDPRSLPECYADVTAWADTWCVGSPRPAAVVWWLNRELADDRPTRRTLTAALLDHPDPDIRAGALWSSAALLDADLLPLIADRLPDEEPENRRLAATLLAAAGSPLPTDNRTPLATDRDPLRANAEHTSAEHAHTDRDPHNTNAEHASAEHTSVERGDHERTDREPRRNRRADTDFGRGIAVLGPFADDLALAARDVYLPAADAALAALALLGDHRAVEPLRHRLFGVRGMSPTRPRCRPWDLPSVTEVLTAMREHADALRPAVHARLSTTTDDAERQALQRVLASWPRQN